MVNTRVLSTLRTRGCGCSGHPAFPTPSMGRKLNAQLGRIAPRGREVVSAVIASGAKRRSNPFFLYAARWIASRSLSSGAHSRDPLARNDGLSTTAPQSLARRMGGAKRYPSVAVGEDDGFREGLNPSYRTTQTRLRVQRAPGIPHALNGAKVKCTARAHRVAGCERTFAV